MILMSPAAVGSLRGVQARLAPCECKSKRTATVTDTPILTVFAALPCNSQGSQRLMGE